MSHDKALPTQFAVALRTFNAQLVNYEGSVRDDNHAMEIIMEIMRQNTDSIKKVYVSTTYPESIKMRLLEKFKAYNQNIGDEKLVLLEPIMVPIDEVNDVNECLQKRTDYDVCIKARYGYKLYRFEGYQQILNYHKEVKVFPKVEI